MESSTKNILFTGLGFLIGTVGLKAAASDTAKRGYVHAMAQGMKCKAEYETLVEQAKAEYDDIKAQATYLVECDVEDEDYEADE